MISCALVLTKENKTKLCYGPNLTMLIGLFTIFVDFIFLVYIENDQIFRDVLVYRNPGVHFGDIHRLKARYLEELVSYVGHDKYAICFPCVGFHTLVDEIVGGDYDGDMYWVSTNPEVISYIIKFLSINSLQLHMGYFLNPILGIFSLSEIQFMIC